MEKRKLLFLFIASLLFILLLGHKAKAQTVKYTSGSLEVDVFVSNPCDGQDNGYIEFNLIAAEGGSATIDLIFGPVSQTNDVIINVGSSYVYNTARTLPSGSYDFYISEDGGNGDVITTFSASVNPIVLTDLQQLVINPDVVSDNTSCASPDGQIIISLTGGSQDLPNGGSYDYTITTDNSLAEFPVSNSYDGTSTIDFAGQAGLSGLPGGTYTITIDDNYSQCSITESFTITDPSPEKYNLTSPSPAVCPGESILLSIDGGESGVTYTVHVNDNPTGVNEVGDGTVPTEITVPATEFVDGDVLTVVATNGLCTPTEMNGSVVAEVSDLITATATITNVSCFGGNDGSIVVNASGGTGSYTYSIDGGNTFQASNSFSNLSAGNYTIIIRDNASCEGSETFEVTQPAEITLNTSSTQTTCVGSSDGSITVAASGGTGTLTYELNPGAITNTTGEFTGLNAGDYTVSVTDEDNCAVTSGTINVASPDPITIGSESSTDISCFGLTDGTVTVTASGGTGSLTYTLSPGGTSNTTGEFTGLGAGDYTVSVTDENNCGPATTGAITVAEPSTITIDGTTSEAATCNGLKDGSITVTASGGTGALTYTLSPGGASNTTGEFTGLGAGDYTVSVTDANNCGPVTTGTITVTEPTAITIDNTNTVDASCNGSADGSITVAASGGTGVLTYTISPGGTSNTTGEFTGLGAGDYTVSVTDENNCGPVSTGSITVGEPTAITIDDANSVAVSCNGDADGSITVAASGGTGTLTYTISPGGTSNTTGEFTGLEAGDYTVSVTDEIDCGPVTSETITVASPGPVTIENTSSTDITCFGLTDGTITVEASGGTGDLIYTLSPGGTTNNTGTFTGLSAGDYTVSVDDQNNCGPVISENIRINEPDKLSIESSGDIVLDCPDDIVSGFFTASGGTSLSSTANKYNFAVNENSTGGIINVSNSRVSLSSAGAGTVTVTVIDKSNCKATSTLTISEPANPLALDNTGDITLACSADTNGSGTFTASGGDVPYTFDIIENTAGAIISVNNTSVDFSDAGAGEITISVTDANCTTTSTVMVNQPNNLSTSVTNTSDCEVSDGSIDLTVTGGVGPFMYNWSNGADTEDINNLNAGSYTVEVTDEGAGCTETISITVSDPSYCKAADCSELDFSPQQLCIDNVLAFRLNDVTGVRSKPLNVEIFRAGSLNPTHTEPFEGIPAGNFLVVEGIQALLGPGDYQVRIVQEQDGCEPAQKISSEFKRFTIAAELQAKVANTAISLPYPETPDGSITLNGFTGGYPDYLVSATLTSPANPIQSFFSDFDTVRFNKDLRYEYSLTGLPAGTYEIEVMDSLGCSIFLEAGVELNTNLFIPNVFTPNGDGKNDTFFIRNLPESDVKLVVSNRWGKQVYSSDNYQNQWDGGNSLEGIYYYQLNVNEKSYSGWLQLIKGRIE